MRSSSEPIKLSEIIELISIKFSIGCLNCKSYSEFNFGP
jgi:hypothetical protein